MNVGGGVIITLMAIILHQKNVKRIVNIRWIDILATILIINAT
jgi:hypothetical protein